jgi:molybdopterin/thiamine biosynthesis adenylyltransferase
VGVDLNWKGWGRPRKIGAYHPATEVMPAFDQSRSSELGPSVADFNYSEAFSRNIGLVSVDEQAQLRRARVAIPGLGGVGGIYAIALARLGIGSFSLSDVDSFELANMNRQAGANAASLGRPKLDVMAEMVSSINPTSELRLFPGGISQSNITAFLDGATAAVDGIDFFAMDSRRLLFREARRQGIYAITSAPVGFGATLHVFSPSGMTFDQYFDIRDGMSLPEQLIHLGLGLTPKLLHLKYFPPAALDLSGRRAPSMGSACLLCAALVATEVANLILRRRPPAVASRFLQFDPMVGRYASGALWWGNRNPVQRIKKWWVLRTNPSLRKAIEDAHG